MGGSVELSQVNKCVASFIQLSFLLVTRNPYKWRQGSLHLETKCYSALEVSSFQKSVLSCLESVDRHDVLSVSSCSGAAHSDVFVPQAGQFSPL